MTARLGERGARTAQPVRVNTTQSGRWSIASDLSAEVARKEQRVRQRVVVLTESRADWRAELSIFLELRAKEPKIEPFLYF